MDKKCIPKRRSIRVIQEADSRHGFQGCRVRTCSEKSEWNWQRVGRVKFSALSVATWPKICRTQRNTGCSRNSAIKYPTPSSKIVNLIYRNRPKINDFGKGLFYCAISERLSYDSSPFILSPVISSRSFRPPVLSSPVISSPGHLVPWLFCPLFFYIIHFHSTFVKKSLNCVCFY
jgi:hypothetical protein